MKIRIKILLGYVLLAVLVVVVALVGFRATHSIGRNFDEAINRTQPVLQALQDIRFESVRLRGDAYRSVYEVQTPASPGVEAAAVPHHRFAELDSALARYRSLVTIHFPDEAADAAKIADEIGAIQEAVEKLRGGALSGAEADRALAALSGSVARVLDATEEAAAAELDEFVAHQRSVDEELAAQERLIAAVALIAVLCAIFAGARIARLVAQPVVALRDAARKLGGGRFDTRVAVTDDTEVGELAQAFNSMAEQLAGSMVSREYVEDIIDSMAEGIIVVDREGRVARVNHAFRTLVRCTDDHVFAGNPIADYLPDSEVIEAAFSTPVARHWIETKMPAADGEVLVVALSVAGLQSTNALAGAVVLVQDITERKRNEERLSYLARYDQLTGLPNRTLLLDHLNQSLSRQPWKKGHTAVLFCDLDRFKFVNDTLGHCVGDLLLQSVADRLQDCVRPGDIVARWSGDEFVVLLNDVANRCDVGPLAEKLVAQLSRPTEIAGHEIFVTASVGIAVSPEHATQSDELIKCADIAMFAAKAEGKNTCRFYSRDMAERSQERLQLERALRRALQEGNQLQVHYQAQKRLDGPLIGFEALVRWQHPEQGLIPPAQFLPVAEEAGLMAAIDETVLRIACAQARQWRMEGTDGLRVAVNVSDHLFRRGDLPELVDMLLAEFDLPPCALELELTEAIVMSDVESSIRTMHRIRDLGVDLSIDDFGTGYSSLAHLKRCPVQMLKIDRSFVNDLMTDPNDAAITEAITALAHKMNIRVIAEGVETVAQLEALRRYGCDAIQGYWLSKPIPAPMLPAFLLRVGHPLAALPADMEQREKPDCWAA
ncbi:bifunctional diguanylate cyclase/phosphodiesterase [Aromatoleum sp.]|uniref:bifunctional diguanylate cyclase/phosphodiesterase n=1 Tax=Aromatoleum sp. TaxID=2307007 RepID=UPI002FCAAE10